MKLRKSPSAFRAISNHIMHGIISLVNAGRTLSPGHLRLKKNSLDFLILSVIPCTVETRVSAKVSANSSAVKTRG